MKMESQRTELQQKNMSEG